MRTEDEISKFKFQISNEKLKTIGMILHFSFEI